MISRREFLGTTVLGGGATALLPGELTAQARYAFVFEPDAGWTVAGQPVEIDIALLGPNGEATAGFYASLDPFHGKPFSRGWGLVYNYLLSNGPRSTQAEDIEKVITHIKIHGISGDELERVYQLAKDVWDKNPHLRINSDQRSDAGIPADQRPGLGTV